MASNNKRSNYLIDKSFQLNFIVKFISLIVACALLSGIILATYYYLSHDLVISGGKEIYVKVLQPEQPKKKALIKDAMLSSGGKYAVSAGNLYIVSDNEMYPVYDGKRYRIEKDRLELFVEVVGTNEKWIGAPEPQGYEIRDGKLFKGVLFGGEMEYDEVKEPARSDKDAKIDFNNLNIVGTYDRFEMVWPALLFSTLLFMVISAIFGIFFTHRLAGPIYRIGLSLDRMIAGDHDFEIKLRKTDAFQHIAGKLNSLNQTILKKTPQKKAPVAKKKASPAKKASPKKKA